MFRIQPTTDEEAATLLTYSKHVFFNWAGYMTGGLIGVGCLFYGVFGYVVGPILLITIGLLALFIVGYFFWRDERSAKDKLALEKAEIEKRVQQIEIVSKPKLSTTVEQFGLGIFSNRDTNLSATCLTFFMGIRNSGAPTTLERWRLRLRVPSNEDEIIINPTVFPEILPLRLAQTVNLVPSDALIQKAGPGKPIDTGNTVSGHITFLTSIPREVINVLGSVAEVEFFDVNGDRHCAAQKSFPVSCTEWTQFIPGMSDQFLLGGSPPSSNKPKRNKKRRR
jgi:uncharacterized membrane protein